LPDVRYNVSEMKMRSLAAVAVAAFAVAPAYAANPVGKWKGTVDAKMPPVPASATPEQKKMMQSAMAMIKNMSFNLDMKANKTYTVEIKGGPNGQTQKETGKWSQKGNTVTLSSTRNGKTQSQNATLSADGKTLTIVPPQQGAPGATKLIFKKA